MFRRRERLADPNCPLDWGTSDAWRSWEPPRGVVRGESYRQDDLVALTGPPREHGYLVPVAVTLRREPRNPHDRNAIRAEVQGKHVGYIAKELAAQVSPAIDRAKCSEFTVAGVIRGGSTRKRHLGVHLWLDHRISAGPDVQFGDDSFLVSWPPHEGEGTADSVRTGASAGRRDWGQAEDSNPIATIKESRSALETETDPLPRHFIFSALEAALYKCRDVFPTALEEFEDICEQHHAEMESIRPALMEEFGGIPYIHTYRQMAIRRSKLKDFAGAADWCKRGLSVYGTDGLRDDEGAHDLQGRLERYQGRA